MIGNILKRIVLIGAYWIWRAKMKIIGIILMTLLIANASIGHVKGDVNYACGAGLDEIYPITCWLDPAPDDLWAVVTIAGDAISYPARIIYPEWAAGQAVFEFITEIPYNPPTYPIPHVILLGDFNDNGVVELSELITVINSWSAGIWPWDLGRVIDAINNWATLGVGKNTPEKMAQMQGLASLMQQHYSMSPGNDTNVSILNRSVSQDVNQVTATSTTTWTCLGGALSFINSYDRPVLCAHGTSVQHAFVRGSNGHLLLNEKSSSGSQWYDLGGLIKGSPWVRNLGVILGLPNAHTIYVQCADDGLWRCDLNLTTKIPTWTSIGGKITSSPKNGYPVISVRGYDGHLWIWNSMSSSFSDLGGYIIGNPSTVYYKYDVGSDKFTCLTFVKGGDNSLWVDNVTIKLSGEVLSNTWTHLGGIIWSDPITAGIKNPINNKIDVYATDRTTSHSLWRYTLDPNTMTGTWSSLGGVVSPDSYPSVAYDLTGKPEVVVRSPQNEALLCVESISGGNAYWLSLGGGFVSDLGIINTGTNLKICGMGLDHQLWDTQV
jgi:hypothetical protein